MKNTVMNNTVINSTKGAPMRSIGLTRGTLALVIVLLSGALAACNPEPEAPAAEMQLPATEPAVVAPAPVPAVTDPMTTPAPAADANATDTAEEEDTPHSGGDKVAPR